MNDNLDTETNWFATTLNLKDEEIYSRCEACGNPLYSDHKNFHYTRLGFCNDECYEFYNE